MKVEVQQMNKTQDALIAIKGATEKMLLEVGIRLSNQAKLLAPVKYGQLRNSISVATKDITGINLNNQQGEKAPPLKSEGLKDREVYVGSNVEHAVYMEYGTKRTHARPFLAPAKEIVINGATGEEIMKKYNIEEMNMRGLVK